VAPQDSQMCGGNFPERKKSAVDLCQILRMIAIEVVINSTCVTSVGRWRSMFYVLRSMHCPAWEDVFVTGRCRKAATCP